MKKIKAILRTFRIQLGKLILDKKHKLAIISNKPKSILFLRHDGKIGDYIVSSFVFREIKKQSPNTKIGVVCSQKNAYLFDNNPYIDHLYIVKVKNILDYIKCGRAIAKEYYDVLINPTVTLRNRDLFFLRTISANYYVGYQKESYKLFNANVVGNNLHFSQIYQQALKLIGFNDICTDYDMPNNKQSEQEITAFIQEKQLDKYITVNFFGAGSARRFSEEKMQALLAYLTSKTILPIVLLTMPNETERLLKLASQYKNVFIYEKTTNVFHTIALIKFSDVLISPDTSTVHIASGFNKKLIAFYNSDEENFIHWHPNNKNETHILRFKNSVNEIDFSEIKSDWLN